MDVIAVSPLAVGSPALIVQLPHVQHFIHRQVGALDPAQRIGAVSEVFVGAERRANPWNPYTGSPEVPVDGWV